MSMEKADDVWSGNLPIVAALIYIFIGLFSGLIFLFGISGAGVLMFFLFEVSFWTFPLFGFIAIVLEVSFIMKMEKTLGISIARMIIGLVLIIWPFFTKVTGMPLGPIA